MSLTRCIEWMNQNQDTKEWELAGWHIHKGFKRCQCGKFRWDKNL